MSKELLEDYNKMAKRLSQHPFIEEANRTKDRYCKIHNDTRVEGRDTIRFWDKMTFSGFEYDDEGDCLSVDFIGESYDCGDFETESLSLPVTFFDDIEKSLLDFEKERLALVNTAKIDKEERIKQVTKKELAQLKRLKEKYED